VCHLRLKSSSVQRFFKKSWNFSGVFLNDDGFPVKPYSVKSVWELSSDYFIVNFSRRKVIKKLWRNLMLKNGYANEVFLTLFR
jgi:hypothetical protein